MKPGIDQDFFTWLALEFSSGLTQVLLVYLVIGVIGMFIHYLKKYLNGDILGNFWEYMLRDNIKHTIASVGGFIISGVGYVYSGVVEGMSWPALIGLAFTTGYSFDSAVNRGAKKEIEKENESQVGIR